MKTIIIALAITSIFAACNSKSETDKNVVGVDTTGLYKNNMIADTAKAEAILLPGSTKKVVETHSADGSVTTTTTTTAAPKTITKTQTHSQNSTAGTTTANTTSQPVATSTQKTGWSSRAKGAVIGGVGGAVVGAAVSKKKGKGAIIGGAIGAAGGYIIGNEKDKKTGR
ncbi:MAG: YMGG-like glycine zipper-containing protein [Ginsengibacter sp.]